MRAGEWLRFRDINAARLSWQRASQVADQLAADDPDRKAMRVAPRALLCVTAFRTGSVFDENAFEETCQLADAADDKVSLAMAMCGRVHTLTFGGRYRESSQLASELVALLESFSDPMLELTLLFGASTAKIANGEITATLRLAQRVIDFAEGDPLKGASVIESPLALALIFRASARMCLGAKGWKADLARAVEMVGEFIPIGESDVLFWKYAFGVVVGGLRPDAAAVRETAEILQLAQQRGDDLSVWSARFLHGFILAQQPEPDRGRGLSLLATVREAVVDQRSIAVFLPLIDIEFAKEKALHGDIDDAVGLLRAILERENGSSVIGPQGPAAEVLVELLLQRGGPADIAAAREAIDRLAAMPTEPGVVIYEIALLRLRALLARACGDEPRVSAVRGSLSRYGERARLRRPHRDGRGDDMTRLAYRLGVPEGFTEKFAAGLASYGENKCIEFEGRWYTGDDITEYAEAIAGLLRKPAWPMMRRSAWWSAIVYSTPPRSSGFWPPSAALMIYSFQSPSRSGATSRSLNCRPSWPTVRTGPAKSSPRQSGQAAQVWRSR